MPRTRTYTDAGYIEVQWSRKGRLVCLVSAERLPDDPDQKPEYVETMHQFSERGDMGVLMRDLTRARKQAFGSGGGDAVIPVLDPDHILLDGEVGKVHAAKVKYT